MQQNVRSGPIDCPAPTPPDPFAIKAFEHAGVCLAVIDAATHRLLSCNRAFARLLGHPVAALIGESWLALHSADTPGAVRNFHARSVDAGPWVYEARLVLLSGATVPVEVSVCDVPETPGGAPYRVISLKDPTGCAPSATAPEPPTSDRRAAPPGPASGQIEAQLRRELERLRSIIENTRAGTWEWNIQTGEAVFDPGWADMIGYDLAELQPISIATWQRLTHPDDLRRAGDLLARHLSGETPPL